MKLRLQFHLAALALACSWSTSVIAQSGEKPPRTISRLFWQDMDSQQLMWGDVKRTDSGLSIEPRSLAQFPKLDTERQGLVQMVASDGVIVVGVRDEDSGKFQSGWVAIDAGVTIEDHGDHFHWYYDTEPKVLCSQLDGNQGNPAHVYLYDGQVVIANDSKNGFTVLDPVQLKQGKGAESAKFYSGGGGHITIAVHSKSVAYSTWIDREGDNLGRIDVVPIKSTMEQKGYSIKLPSGGLHGATAAGDRVFFAPANGIYSVKADVALSHQPSPEEIEHISLGVDPVTNRPNRTGAFSSHDNWVLFSYGSGENSKIGMLNTKEPKLKLRELSLPAGEGLSLTTPAIVSGPKKKAYALVAHDRKQSQAAERISIIDLDPNADSDFSDANVAATVNVGPSRIERHSGHHDISFTPNKRMACICNAGDGTLSVLNLSDLAIQSTLTVGGAPARVVAQ